MKIKILFFLFLTVTLFLQEEMQAQDWIPIEAQGPPISNSLDAVDENIAWYAVGGFGLTAIFKTTDGGATLTQNDLPVSEDQIPYIITALDDQTAFVGTTNNSTGFALRTVDGGATWENLNLGEDQEVRSVLGIHFYNELEGFLMLLSTTSPDKMSFLTTGDGGDTWQENEAFPTEEGDLQYIYNSTSIYEVKDNYIWIGTISGKILRSKDKGLTWEALDWISDDATSIAFKDTLNGIVVNTGNITGGGINGDPTKRTGYRTSDGGNTWAEIFIPNDLETVEYVPGSDGVYIGTESFTIKSYYYITKDNGDNWEERPAIFLMDVDFLDNETGWGTNGFGIVKWGGGPLTTEEYVEVVHTVPYSENFDNDLPSQYEIGGGFYLTSAPFRTDEYAALGVVKDTEFAGASSFDPWWTFTTIETAAIQLPTEFPTQLSFEAFFTNMDAEDANERAFVSVSTDGKKTWSLLYDLEEEALADWKMHTVALSAYQGQKIHLSFNYEDPSLGNAFGFFFDNIELSEAKNEVSTQNESTAITVCSGDNISNIIGLTNNTPTDQSTQYTYIMIYDDNRIAGEIPYGLIEFEGSPTLNARIYGLAYTGNLTFNQGDDFTTAVLSDGMADLSSNFIDLSIQNGGCTSGIDSGFNSNLAQSRNAIDMEGLVYLTKDGISSNSNMKIAEGTVKVFPNPAINEIFVNISDISTQGNIELTVVDLLGRTLIRKEVNTKQQKVVNLDVSNFKKGINYICIRLKDGQLVDRKLILIERI